MNTKKLSRTCPICGCKKGEILHTQKFILPENSPLPNMYDVVSCCKCSFTFADTKANQQTYDTFYESQSKYEDKKTSSGGGFNVYDLLRINETVEEIIHSCPDKNARIIDIGCANGGILRLLKEKGYKNLLGYDPSKKCVESMQNEKITCLQGSIFNANNVFANQQFDCILLSHVMEHIYDLQKAFTICFNLLTEGGLLYIEVPDAARYSDFFVTPYYYFDSEHINHFDEISLSNLGLTLGFRIKNIGHKEFNVSDIQQYPALFIVFSKTLYINHAFEETKCLPAQHTARQSIMKYVELSAQNTQNEIISELLKTQEEILIFGAGNFTIRLLASTDLGKCNIKAFIDNDTNKQGQTLIDKPVLSSDILKNFNGTILVCAALFSQEIEKQVKDIRSTGKTIILQ